MAIKKENISVVLLPYTDTTTKIRASIMYKGSEISAHAIVSNKIVQCSEYLEHVKDILRETIINAIS